MTDELDDDLIREMYAMFGLAYYQSECLHRELCIVLAWSGLPSRELITRPRVEERLAQAFSLTLGDVVRNLDGVLPAELAGEIREAVDIRNFLAHHFWFERVHLMFSVTNVRQLITELDGYAGMFDRLHSIVSQWQESMHAKLGFTDEVIEKSLCRILAGELEEPLPDKQAVKELEKRLGKRQRLIRVWECALELEHGGRPLIFQLADGSMWQLCDVGLDLTRFQEAGPGWTEHPAIKPYLPADIHPRPKTTAQWEYEFTLALGAVLWVKPCPQRQTFKWGVRKPRASSEQGTTLNRESASHHPRQ